MADVQIPSEQWAQVVDKKGGRTNSLPRYYTEH